MTRLCLVCNNPRTFKHPNVLGLIGVILNKKPGMIVMEMMVSNLQSQLRSTSFRIECVCPPVSHVEATCYGVPAACFRSPIGPPVITLSSELLTKAMEVAAGVEYIHHQNILHCDLAARNILVGHSGQVGLWAAAMAPSCFVSVIHVCFPA
jgi:serine/threonine protein kinase